MILKALADYYDRLAKDNDSGIAPNGWFRGKIDFVVVLNESGNFVRLQNIRQPDRKRMVGRPTMLPFIGKQALKHANSGKDANLLWDNASFVFGLGNKGRTKIESFIETLSHHLGHLNDLGVSAVLTFLKSGIQDATVFDPVLNDTEYGSEISKGAVCVTFALDGDSSPFVYLRPSVKTAISLPQSNESAVTGTCLITGDTQQPIELCHTVIKNIYGTQKDPNFISFNKDAFNSFGKHQGMNAPSSKRAVFAYITALNYLLASEHNRIQVGDASTVFWAKEFCDLEADLPFYLAPKNGEETVSCEKVRSLFASVMNGVPQQEGDLPFYVLGLAPNGPRLSVRFWYDGTVKELKERIAKHFSDIEMTRPEYERPYLTIKELMLATTRHSASHVYGEDGDILPHLSGQLFRSILTGCSYPLSVLQKLINRVKAEQALTDNNGKRRENVSYARASLIKGVLARHARLTRATTKEVGVSLDREYGNIGYVLGRLFAALERIQEQAQGRGLNKTIRDTYFGAAASSPLVTFKRLQDLAIHHLAKIRNGGKSTVWLERLLQEVMDLVPAQGIPSILGLEDQGRFAVGYYHQRQDFFTKKDAVETETINEGEDA
jgi:CRISPR-associated protein Csd1